MPLRIYKPSQEDTRWILGKRILHHSIWHWTIYGLWITDRTEDGLFEFFLCSTLSSGNLRQGIFDLWKKYIICLITQSQSYSYVVLLMEAWYQENNGQTSQEQWIKFSKQTVPLFLVKQNLFVKRGFAKELKRNHNGLAVLKCKNISKYKQLL